MYFDNSILSARFLDLYRKLYSVDYIDKFLSKRVLDNVSTISFLPYEVKKVSPKVSGRNQGFMKMIEIPETGGQYFLAGGYNNHYMMPFLSRFYNFLGCQTFNVVIGAAKDGDGGEDCFFYLENLLKPYKDLCQIGKEFNRDVGMFYIFNNENLMKQFLYRNVFVSLMGDKDAHLQNLFFNKSLLFHIDLEKLNNFSCGTGFFSGTSCGEINDINLSITLYFLFMDKAARAKTAEFSRIKDVLKEFREKTFNFMRFNSDLDIATFKKQINDIAADESTSMQNKMLLEAVSNVLDKYCQTVDSADSKKVRDFIEYIDSDLYLNHSVNNILDNIENNFYDITKVLVNLTQKDMNFLGFEDKEAVDDLFEENDRTDFLKSVEAKRVEMLYYAARHNKIHKILELDEEYEGLIHEILKIDKLKYAVSTDPKLRGYEWQVESSANRKAIADSISELAKVTIKLKFIAAQDLGDRSESKGSSLSRDY